MICLQICSTGLRVDPLHVGPYAHGPHLYKPTWTVDMQRSTLVTIDMLINNSHVVIL